MSTSGISVGSHKQAAICFIKRKENHGQQMEKTCKQLLFCSSSGWQQAGSSAKNACAHTTYAAALC